MCIESTTFYQNCLSVAVNTVICLEHINHTRAQIDNAPCPKYERVTESSYSQRCYCRNGGQCVRRRNGAQGDNGHSWRFEKEGSFRAKKESMYERDQRRLTEVFNQIRIMKNELSFLKYTSTQEDASNSKRRKRNDKSSEHLGDRTQSEPPESNAAGGDTTMSNDGPALYSETSVDQFNREKKIRQLERDIDSLTQSWIARGGKDPAVKTTKKPESYRPNYPANEQRLRGRKRSEQYKKRQGELYDLLEDDSPARDGDNSADKSDGKDQSIDTKIKQEPTDDIEMA